MTARLSAAIESRYSVAAVLWWTVILGGLGIATLTGDIRLSTATLSIIALCAVCELIDSSLGMGYGTTLTPLLLMAGFDPLQLVPTILISEFVSGFAAGFFHSEAGNLRLERRSPHLKIAVVLSACSLIGVFVGVELALNISATTLTRLIGLVVLTSGVTVLIGSRRVWVYRTWKIGLLGVVASFNKAVSGGGYGPLMTTGQILSGVKGSAAIGISSLAEGFTCLSASALFLVRGETIDIALLIPIVAGAQLTVPFSAQIVRKVPEKALMLSIGLLTVAMGVFTVLRTILN